MLKHTVIPTQLVDIIFDDFFIQDKCCKLLDIPHKLFWTCKHDTVVKYRVFAFEWPFKYVEYLIV